jgi:hypothetical protein
MMPRTGGLELSYESTIGGLRPAEETGPELWDVVRVVRGRVRILDHP